jgi:hypothetical protein
MRDDPILRCAQNDNRAAGAVGRTKARESLVVLEILNRAFVLLRCSFAVERAEVFSFARFRIFLAGIQPILAGFQFSDHR